jgi:hypothetical protein
VSGPNIDDSRQYADKLRAKLAQVPTLRDLGFEQELDYPTVNVTVDRERAGVPGVTADDVGKSVFAGTSSSRARRQVGNFPQAFSPQFGQWPAADDVGARAWVHPGHLAVRSEPRARRRGQRTLSAINAASAQLPPNMPSTHMRCMITANRRARATIAFFIPRRLATCIAQAFRSGKEDHEQPRPRTKHRLVSSDF